MVVTASGGGWKDEPCAMAVWIWRNFTKPRAPTNRAMTANIRIIRFAMSFLFIRSEAGVAITPEVIQARLVGAIVPSSELTI